MFNKKKCGCLVSAAISAILGIIVGFIAYNAVIAGIVTVIWIAFGIGVLALVLTMLAAIFVKGRDEWSVSEIGPGIAIGAVGTIIATIIGLSIPIVTGVIGIALLIGIGTFFLAFTKLGLLQLIVALTNVDYKCRD